MFRVGQRVCIVKIDGTLAYGGYEADDEGTVDAVSDRGNCGVLMDRDGSLISVHMGDGLLEPA